MRIVRATKKDSLEIKEFLRKNDPEDYVLDVIDHWLENDTIFIAVEDRMIGIVRLKYSLDGEAWLGGIRVDKDHRRKGMGTLLTEKCIEEAKTKKARLFTTEGNTAALHHVQKMRFNIKGHYTLMYSEIGEEKHYEIKKGNVWNKLEKSKILERNNFLLPQSFTFYKIAPDLIKESYVSEDGYAVVERVNWEEDSFWGENLFEITYFEGEKIIDGLKYLAFKSNHKKIWALIPRDENLISILTKKGFKYEKWAKYVVVFEKTLML
ncbi:MAG: GNAT family N-acetyltransferase [Methanomicrobia archaeon]|nr:GNAT family N-acetyltransferase [Methanomicrobia archaeon]